MINVLVVEDELVVGEAHSAFVARVPGFAVAGHVRSGVEALRRIAVGDIDLLLLDIYLPEMTGLDLLRTIRSAGDMTDVITVTRSGDLAVVRAAVSYGAVGYLIKPFTFVALQRKLESYRAYRAGARWQHDVGQREVDRLLATLRTGDEAPLPAGIARESLDAVVDALVAAGVGCPMSAAEIAEVVGASRVTARRYLEYLADGDVVTRHARYKGAGRPEVEYLLRVRHAADSHTAAAD